MPKNAPDGTTSPSSSTDSTSDLSALAEGIVDSWLDALPEAPHRSTRTSALLDAYRALAVDALSASLTNPTPGQCPPDLDERPGLSRALAAVVTEHRRSDLTIAGALEDFSRLTPTAVACLRVAGPGGGGSRPIAEHVLDVAESVTHVLGAVQYRLARLLEASAARAQRERATALAAMTDVLSHELRNRLGAAQTASRLLLSKELHLDDAELARVARLVQASVEDALKTVGDVRTLAATSANLETKTVRRMPLPGLVASVVQELRAAAEEVGVQVRVIGEPVDCEVDASRLRLILYNLVGNGIKYHDPDEPHPWVRVECTPRAQGRVEIQVRDNGIGIPEDEVDDIFLYRMRGTRGNGLEGSGLGLAIAREAVDQIGGEISVQSQVGAGTTFSLVFTPLHSGS